VTIPDQKLVTGIVVDCDSLPIAAGYVLVNGAAHFCMDGVFDVYTCASTITLRGVDALNSNVSTISTVELVTDTTEVGAMVACTPIFGTVTDIEGNSYQTVLIGNQEWMAENLRTGTYRNGDTIPNVTGSYAMINTTSGAWCNYDNNPVHDPVYGKLYNFQAARNPNICPQGWHMPQDAEWRQLEAYLGMPTAELGQNSWRGSAENVGGKLKAVTLWNAPNTGATNESGFSGLPGGGLFAATGAPSFLGEMGYYWSSTLASGSPYTYGFSRILRDSNAGIARNASDQRLPLSIRCVRD
jgi:uncharacterized protein (TIGR02145 family)